MTEVPPLFLCATSRLAQSLREQAPAAGSGAPAAWRAPLVYTLGQWLSGLAEEAALLGTAEIPCSLSPYCERLLWEGIIADRLPAHSAPLFDITGMARSAMEAHAITRQWQLPAACLALTARRRWNNACLPPCGSVAVRSTAPSQPVRSRRPP